MVYSLCEIVCVYQKHPDGQTPSHIFRKHNSFALNGLSSVVLNPNWLKICVHIHHKWIICFRYGLSCESLNKTFSQKVSYILGTDVSDLIQSNYVFFHVSHISISIWISYHIANIGNFSHQDDDSHGQSMLVWLSLLIHIYYRHKAWHLNEFFCVWWGSSWFRIL